jgi:hypothetical protein
VAPQFEHSALTPPGTLLTFAPDGGRVVETLVALAPGPEERVVVALWVRTLSVGRDELGPGGVSLLWPSFAGDTVCSCCEARRAKWA